MPTSVSAVAAVTRLRLAVPPRARSAVIVRVRPVSEPPQKRDHGDEKCEGSDGSAEVLCLQLSDVAADSQRRRNSADDTVVRCEHDVTLNAKWVVLLVASFPRDDITARRRIGWSVRHDRSRLTTHRHRVCSEIEPPRLTAVPVEEIDNVDATRTLVGHAGYFVLDEQRTPIHRCRERRRLLYRDVAALVHPLDNPFA